MANVDICKCMPELEGYVKQKKMKME